MNDKASSDVDCQVEQRVMERLGFCPVCLTERPSLPEPASGTCAYCHNHLMKPCSDCANHRTSGYGLEPKCIGGVGRGMYAAWYARREDALCGSDGKWAVFHNA